MRGVSKQGGQAGQAVAPVLALRANAGILPTVMNFSPSQCRFVRPVRVGRIVPAGMLSSGWRREEKAGNQ
jgi:hypothetical protein